MKVRKLGHRETLCKLAHQHCAGTGLITFHCRIQGLLDVSILVESLTQLVQEVLVLNLTFMEGDDRYFYKLNTSPEKSLQTLPISILANKSDEHWQKIFEKENNTPIDFINNYLWRVVILNNIQGLPNKHDLVISFHHAIFDSKSFIILVKKWLSIYDAILNHSAVSEINEVADSLESSIEERITRNRYLLKQIGYFTKNWFIKRPKLNYENDAHLNERCSKNIFVDIPEIEKLILLCREQKVTLGALLSAALLKSVQENKALLNPNGLKLVTAVDFRDKMQVENAELSLGMYVSSAYTYHAIGDNSDIWQIAKNYRRELVSAIDRCIIPYDFYPLQLSKKFKTRAIKSSSNFSSGLSISNIGAINFESSSLKITDFQFCSNRQVGDFLININASSLNGKLRLACTYVDPLLSHKNALKMVSRMVEYLECVRAPLGDVAIKNKTPELQLV